jgi:tetratricopeptide (TPR) repeat protein
MTDMARDAEFLKHKQVAFTGRLASMTRKEAEELVRTLGGHFSPTVNSQTAFLIVGQEGWPLRLDGRLTHKLQKARLLSARGQPIGVVSEEQWLTRLGLDARRDEIRRLYSAAELIQLLSVSRNHLRAWVKAGLIQPSESSHGMDYFDFGQVAGAKTLCELIKAGVTIKRIRHSFQQLKEWAGSIQQPQMQLAVLEKDGALLVRIGESLADPNGQMLLDFDEEGEASLPLSESPLSADQWFDLAYEHESAGRLKEAETGYRQALLTGGPDTVCCFNLANVLYAQGRNPEAMERYSQVVEMEATNAEAWNNLGTVLADLGRLEQSKEAYQKAVELGYNDSHFNLADLLNEAGDRNGARCHWQAYLQQDQQSPWAKYARSRLEKIS